MLTDRQMKLAALLYQVGAVKFGEFKLKAHEQNPNLPPSPIYLNLRTPDHPTKDDGTLTPEIMELVGQEFGELIKSLGTFEHFADIPDAGKPFGDQFERFVPGNVTRLTLTKVIRDDGTRYITDEVSGDFAPGESCVLVDELITRADSKIEAIDSLRNAGLQVEDVVVLVDRMQGGGLGLLMHGCTLHSVLTLPNLLQFYVEADLISSEREQEVLNYLRANSR